MSASGPSDLLRSTRRVMLSGELTSETAGEAAIALMYLDGLSDEPVSLMVNAGAGTLEDIAGLSDTLALMRAPVTVDVRGRAHAAAGALVAAAPGVRRLGPMGSVSLRTERRASLPAGLTAQAAADLANLHAETQRRFAATIGSRCSQTIDWVLNEFDRGAVFAPEAAMAAGLVDSLH